VDPVKSYQQLKSYLTRKYLTNNRVASKKRERFDIQKLITETINEDSHKEKMVKDYFGESF
jgi:hypothetical protein